MLGPGWAVATEAEAEVSQSLAPCQRLVEDTESVGDEGGGKLSSSRTATPTLLRRVNMQEAATHLLLRGLYFSIELRLELPSLPPTAYSQPSIATRSWVLLWEDMTTCRLSNSSGTPQRLTAKSSGCVSDHLLGVDKQWLFVLFQHVELSGNEQKMLADILVRSKRKDMITLVYMADEWVCSTQCIKF